MPRNKPSLAERKRLLKETKQRLRLQQEARTIKRIEELDIEACERLGGQLQLEHLELNGELDCSETDTARQYTLHWSDSEEGLCQTLYTLVLLYRTSTLYFSITLL